MQEQCRKNTEQEEISKAKEVRVEDAKNERAGEYSCPQSKAPGQPLKEHATEEHLLSKRGQGAEHEHLHSKGDWLLLPQIWQTPIVDWRNQMKSVLQE